jgi:hypothetical protein
LTILLTAAVTLPGLAAQAATDKAPPRILVGPNILVSRDGDVPHVELMVVGSPKRTAHLLGGAITATRPNGGWACRAYSSTDGGARWKASEFTEQVEFGGADPQVVFTAQGTALFSALTMNKNEKGRECASMHVWRSENAGQTWLPATEITCSPSWDHPQIAVDLTSGRHAGRIYIGVLYDYPVYRVGIFRSDDDGRTWIGPVEAANGGGDIGINVVNVMVLADGTLMVPYVDFEFKPEKRTTKGKIRRSAWLVTSSDGGLTFSAPRKVATHEYNFDDPDIRTSGAFTALAADNGSKKFIDRLYTAWSDSRFGKTRVLFSRSADRGKTWSEPKPLDGSIPAGARQWQPVIAVNKDGVVAVTWYDTRHSKDGKQYDQYFAASLDGGESFLPSVKISSAPSDPLGSGNSRITPMAFTTEGAMHLSFLSAASRWASGGDYMGLTADKEGVFHPFWADSRTGTFQIYTARVKVEAPEKKESAQGETKAAASTPEPPEPARIESELLGKVELIFDPTRYDAEKKELEIPVRLKNISKEPIYPPIRLEVTRIGFPRYESEDDKKENAENAPRAINTSNGKEGVGAIFELEGVVGTLESLEPEAQSGPAVLRFRLADPRKTPSLQIKITGQLSKTS